MLDKVRIYRESIESDLRTLQSGDFKGIEQALRNRYAEYQEWRPTFASALEKLLDEELAHLDSERRFYTNPTYLRSKRLRTLSGELNTKLLLLLRQAGVDIDGSPGESIRVKQRHDLDRLKHLREETTARLQTCISLPSVAIKLVNDGHEQEACDVILDFMATHMFANQQ